MIVADFEGRDAHLTGVPIADTALLMEALGERRGMAARPESPLMPASLSGKLSVVLAYSSRGAAGPR